MVKFMMFLLIVTALFVGGYKITTELDHKVENKQVVKEVNYYGTRQLR